MSKLIIGTMPDDEIAIDPVDYAIYHLYQSDYWIVGSNRYTLDHQYAYSLLWEEMRKLDNEWFEKDDRWYV